MDSTETLEMEGQRCRMIGLINQADEVSDCGTDFLAVCELAESEIVIILQDKIYYPDIYREGNRSSLKESASELLTILNDDYRTEDGDDLEDDDLAYEIQYMAEDANVLDLLHQLAFNAVIREAYKVLTGE